MPFLTDAFGTWLIELIAESWRKRLMTWVLGPDQERELRQAAAIAVQQAAQELCSGADEQAQQLAMVIDEVFDKSKLAELSLAEHATLLEAIEEGIKRQLEPLGDDELTGIGSSSASLLGQHAWAIARSLAGHFVREIIARGAAGGPLMPLANQLNHDVTHLQGMKVEARLEALTGHILPVVEAIEKLTGPKHTPNTLPADTVFFTGRQIELGLVMRDLPKTTGVVRIDAVDGMAGVGKTAFAVHAAHGLASRFPDGQLFLRLHGHTPDRKPLDPIDALAILLLELGVPPQHIPRGTESRAAMWRDQLGDRKLLLVLDDAASSQQVRPLLPGSTAGILVIITSRHRLAALPEAFPITLDTMPPAEAATLFEQLSGAREARLGADAVAQIAEQILHPVTSKTPQCCYR